MLEKYLNENSFIELVLKDDIPEENIASGIPFINDNRTTILDLFNFFQRAVSSSASGILLKIKNLNIGLARADEIRSLLLDFRKSGKIVYAYLEEAGNTEYYIATAADKIFVPPWTTINLVGLSFESVYIKEFLDILKIEPEIDGFGEYKSAADMFNRKDMSPYHREMMGSLLDNTYNNFIKNISQDRDITITNLKKLIDKNPLSPETAKKYKLIDEIFYENEIIELFNTQETAKPKIIKYKKFTRNHNYINLPNKLLRLILGKNNFIGYININGMITQGESKKGSGFINTCGSDTVIELIRKAAEDKSVKAVIIRVLSPGGSALASDLIRNEIEILRDKKPVYISMSDVAASGGYMVSLSSTGIAANPFTITGSIGVVAGKFNFKKLLNRYGIYSETLQKGKMAKLYSTNKPFTPEEKKKFIQIIKEMYSEFVKLVSVKRKLDIKQAENAAKGRVWSSNDALEMRLIDSTGYIKDIISEISNTLAGGDEEIYYIKEFKTKNKLSFSNIGKLSLGGISNELTGVYSILKKERLYAITPFNFKIK